MATGTVTESRPVAKKRSDKGPPADEPSFGRIELQAPPDWIEQLDAVAAAVGLSRSAYIRMACNMKMAADRRQLGLSDPKKTGEGD